jgi:hypothetical protein
VVCQYYFRFLAFVKNNTVRRYYCRRCNTLVDVCSSCDRGNIYCGKECSSLQRLENQRRSNKTYRNDPISKIQSKGRQQRFRNRIKEKRSNVTEQGSKKVNNSRPFIPDEDNQGSKLTFKNNIEQSITLKRPSISNIKALLSKQEDVIRCSFCSSICSTIIRHSYLEDKKHQLYKIQERGS